MNEGEQAAFEAAMRVKHPEWAFTADPVFDYHNERTRCAWEGWQAARSAGEEPVAYVNRDELDNMLGDRTASIAGVRDGWRKTPLYLHPLGVLGNGSQTDSPHPPMAPK